MTISVEYIWIDGFNSLRSKTRCFKDNMFEGENDNILEKIPKWNYDGSSTGQATTEDSEIQLIPVSIYESCFKEVKYLILCETWTKTGPHPSNNRDKYLKSDIKSSRFGFEQEFFLTDNSGSLLASEDTQQKMFYCGVGHTIGRHIVNLAMTRCIESKLNITGMNAEVAPGQWELQIDDYNVLACDGLWMLRYILIRTAEEFNYKIDFNPKPLEKWNGSGCHANFSTPAMLAKDGYNEILRVIKNLSLTHTLDILNYGENNNLRLTGMHETSSIDKFTFGIGNRAASIRIPNDTFKFNSGYFEDRRPASNMDPYLVGSILNKASI